MRVKSINPATGETLAEFESLTSGQVEACLARASDAALQWRYTTVDERVAVVTRLAELLEAEKDRIGRMMTLEMGKPIQSAIDEAAKCAATCRFYAEHGPAFIADAQVADAEHHSYIAYEPLGVVLAVMPWNFPFWQVVRFLAPALVAGNAGLLKHASNVPQCALELESLVRRAGAPTGVFQALLVGSAAIPAIIADPRVAAVTLTGSEGAGRSVAKAAGEALKPSVLELGGSDPFIVMPSADVALASQTAVKARTMNNGQSCIADQQVRKSVELGARLICGGVHKRGSAFYPATVLADIPDNAPAYSEELFGPVGCIFVAQDVSDAIRIANDTRFGLASSVWTQDLAEQDRFARELDAGSVFVNDMVVSDPRFPFGGVKASGYGRELSELGLRAFTNIKTVRMRHASGAHGGATE